MYIEGFIVRSHPTPKGMGFLAKKIVKGSSGVAIALGTDLEKLQKK